MTVINSLSSGSEEDRDCSYHLFFYRCLEFPCIMRPIRAASDPDSIVSFLTSIALPDLQVPTRPRSHAAELTVAAAARGRHDRHLLLPHASAREQRAHRRPALCRPAAEQLAHRADAQPHPPRAPSLLLPAPLGFGAPAK